MAWRQEGEGRKICSDKLREGVVRSHEVGRSVYHVSGHTTRIEGLENSSIAASSPLPVSLLYTNLGKKRKIYDRLISIVATARLHLRPHDKGDFFSGVAGNFELLAFVPAKAFEIDMAPLRTLPWVS